MRKAIAAPTVNCPDNAAFACRVREYTVRPNAVVAMHLGIRWTPLGRGLGLLAATGLLYAPRSIGEARNVSAMISVGAEYEFGSSSRLLPVLGVRYVCPLSNPGGVRAIISPVFGLRF